MAKSWLLQDLLDLLFLLDLDKKNGRSPGELDFDTRDRTIYLGINPSSHSAGAKMDPRTLLRHWVEARRQQVTDSQDFPGLPGAFWQEINCTLSWLFLLTGIVSGFVVTVPVLSYSGEAPINVTFYFFFFVGLQILLFFLQLGALTYNGVQGRKMPASLVLTLMQQKLFALVEKLLNRLAQKRTPSTVHSLHAIRLSARRYDACTPIVLWSMFLWLQLLGMGFNGGVLLVTLGKVLVTDIAFGWQSTLQIDAAQLGWLVQWAATPWSWFVPEQIAYPSLEAIAGSKMILKEGLYHLTTNDLVAWWPFLCFSVLTYGLLPRLLLYLWSRKKIGALLSVQPRISTAMYMVIQRMTNAVVATAAQPVKRKTAPSEIRSAPERSSPASSTRQGLSVTVPMAQMEAGLERKTTADLASELELGQTLGPQSVLDMRQEGSDDSQELKAFKEPRGIQETEQSAMPSVVLPEEVVLLVPDEIYDDIPLSELQDKPHPLTGTGHAEILRYGSLEGDEGLLADIRQRKTGGTLLAVTMLAEGWQPPIRETLSFLRLLRESAGRETAITLWLLGKPTPQSLLNPGGEGDLSIWQEKVKELVDPHLDIVRFSHE
ncbi:MAG: hypothetical protein CSA33_08945 [Desulfobulbus propionicus]|nr:MAG: hypothetical protein CSA33_08945 [Desulfobulbus propionicus]